MLTISVPFMLSVSVCVYVLAAVVVVATGALGGIDNWSTSVGKIAVGSGFDSGNTAGGPSARQPDGLRESSRLASTFAAAAAPASSPQQVGAAGGDLETIDPLAIDAFASSGFGMRQLLPWLASDQERL